MREVLLSIYPWIKAAHMVMVIAWMAGMMYLPRLFIYHHQAVKGGEAAGYFAIMERRLLKGVINPSMIMVWVLAGIMLYANPDLFSAGWFHVKLTMVLMISGIHGFYASAFKKFEAGELPAHRKILAHHQRSPVRSDDHCCRHGGGETVLRKKFHDPETDPLSPNPLNPGVLGNRRAGP